VFLSTFVGTNKFAGEEDCLFMDITVPGGVQPGAKKPVMVWIHGGAFITGSGRPYIGAALATTGDVITVSINYRLGVLGFLAIEKGKMSRGKTSNSLKSNQVCLFL